MVDRRARARWMFVLAVLILLPQVTPAPGQVVSDVTALKKTALAIAPQDVAFFATNLNLKAAWDKFLSGSFVTRLRALPYVQRLESEALAQWENPEGQMKAVRDGLKNPNVKNLLSLLVDMNSREVFCYGESDWNESIEGLMDFYSDVNSRSGNPVAMQEFLAELDADYLDEIIIPTTVIGFRLSDDETARTLLDALQGALQLGLQQVPELAPIAKQIVRKDLKDGQVLSITLTTSLIPMDKLDAETQEFLAGVLEGLADRQLVISLGLRNKTLLMSISEDDSPILTIGEGDKLVDHERLEILRKNMPKDLRSVAYISGEWRESQWAASYGSYFEKLANQFAAAVSTEESDEVDIEDWQEEVMEDAVELDERIAELEIEFDASLSWSFASDVGLEGMSYDWSTNAFIENAEPMTIVQHAGTQPLLLLAIKQKEQPLLVELAEEVIERAPAHLRRFVALAEQEQEQRDLSLAIIDKAWPLVEQSFAIVQDEILPALDENEGLVSLAAQRTTTELSLDFPPAARPLPLPELAVVLKLGNRDQFLSGCSELFEVFDQVVDLVREFQPDAIPEGYEVPRPQQEELAGATRFYYSEFSQAVPFEGFQPQVVVGNDIVVIGYSSRQVLDLKEDKPLATRPAWLAPEMPVAMMSLVDGAGMVDAVSPWLSYGFGVVLGDLDTPLGNGEGPIPSGRDIVQIWECFTALGKSASTTVIDAEGATVSRWVWVGE